MIGTTSRLDNYPFALASELRDAANEHGFRIGPEQASGWIFFRSASAVGEVYRKSVSLPTLPLEQFERETATLGNTEIERIEKVRIGQGIFRKALLTYWKDTCPITGITDTALLRASHIIPWARCESDAERMNVHNGLLLSSLWDAAFDQGLVSFDDEGRPIASSELTDAAIAALQVGNAAPLPLTPEHRAGLAWHRKHLWQG